MVSKQLISNTVKAVFFATKKNNFFTLFLSEYQLVNGLFICSTLDNFIVLITSHKLKEAFF